MSTCYDEGGITIYHGDAVAVLAALPDGCVNCCVTSPPYWGLRDYGVAGQIGLESTPDAYVAKMVEVFREVRRVLRDDGTLWLNLGDAYASGKGTCFNPGGGPQSAIHNYQDKQRHPLNPGNKSTLKASGLKPKDLVGIPWRVAFALQADGWYLRQDIIWHKPNPMPNSMKDRCTTAHEYIFLLSKSARYYYNAEAVQEPSVTDDPRRPYGSPGANALDARGEQGAGRERGPANRKRGEFNGKTNSLPGREAFRVFTEKRNRRSVWTVTPKPYKGAHFATFPPDLIDPCIKAGCPAGGVVLDPFFGSGTTAKVAQDNGCKCIGIELNESYITLALDRLRQGVLFGAESTP